ncbi:hypothetical protein N8955_01125 [bacterium]|jgi:hypothetical protein|nr:hypothetical protein [Hellea sp.]MDA7807315.1 hypothetical protein [bacterium]MDA9047654.1 hypothetical protein [Hellea sp.]MDA9225281.1 hypothetical protein [bacterium]
MNSILDSVFPMTLLGKTYTSKPDDLKDRTDMFREMWDSWSKTSIVLPANIGQASAYGSAKYLAEPGNTKTKQFGRKHKLKEFWDFQIRGNEVRFADEDMALLFRLTL